jgi:hypothetical protein
VTRALKNWAAAGSMHYEREPCFVGDDGSVSLAHDLIPDAFIRCLVSTQREDRLSAGEEGCSRCRVTETSPAHPSARGSPQSSMATCRSYLQACSEFWYRAGTGRVAALVSQPTTDEQKMRGWTAPAATCWPRMTNPQRDLMTHIPEKRCALLLITFLCPSRQQFADCHHHRR